MPTSQTSRVQISATASIQPSTPNTGAILAAITADLQLTPGSGAGKADQAYRVDGSLTASGSDTYNVLAAGALKTPLGETVDLDEVKAVIVKCLTGTVNVEAAASNGLGCFTGAGEGVKLAAGQIFALGLGSGGVTVGSAGSLTVAEAGSPAAAATYELLIIGST